MKTTITKAFLFVLLGFTLSYAQVDYLMTLSNWEMTNATTYEFDIFIKSRSTDFGLTSYQCAFGFNQNIVNSGNLTFTYINGSSQFTSIPPEVGISVTNTDGLYELSFASMPGLENISGTEVKVGRFRLVNTANFTTADPSFKWNFNGIVSTILTGSNFSNITVPANHIDGALAMMQVSNVWASATTDLNTSPQGTTDGLGYYSGNNNSRWAANPMPQWITWDLGQVTNISQTKISFYDFLGGRIYVYSVLVGTDTVNWTTAVNNASSVADEWTVNQFSPIQGRYVRLVCHSNSANDWANVWEVEIWGSDQTTGVDLSALTAAVSNNNVTLSWSTSSESNNNGFEIQRRSDGNFETIAFIAGNGTTTTAHNYTYTDVQPIIAHYVYRLKQIDFDGTFSYSNEVEVNLLPESYELFQNYPNPFNPSTKVKFNLPVAERAAIYVYDMLGQKVMEVVNKEFTAGTHEVEIDASNLSSGVYVYQLNVGNNFSAIKKMMVMK
ncbi:MAG: discoidin domain-containing protein [Ignavibacteriales bacterium]|nr:MAG: discoidin domain-containing protein [Ignavibacteriales bacterium]